MISMLIFEGSCNSELFIAYIEQILCPELTPGTVVIMDNASFHKSSRIKELIESKGCTLLYLPPYSPERNPIEKYWSILRKKVKQIQCTTSDIYDAISEALLQTQNFGQP